MTYDIFVSPPEWLLEEFYSKLSEEGLLDVIFTEVDVASYEDFRKYFTQKGLYLFPVYSDGSMQGAAWIDCLERRSARIHFTTLKASFPRTISSGRAVLKYIASMVREDGEFCFDCLFGETPINNPMAVKYARKMFGVQTGTIPNRVYQKDLGVSVDAVISTINLEEARNAKETFTIRSSSFSYR